MLRQAFRSSSRALAAAGACTATAFAVCEPSIEDRVAKLEKVVAQLEAISSPDGYDTAISESLLAKYAADKDAYIADCIPKLVAARASNPSNITATQFSLAYFDSLSESDKKGLAMCVNSGAQNADSGMGCYAMEPADYDKYGPFFSRVIAAYHKVPRGTKHVTDWSLAGEGMPADGVLDLSKLGLPALSMRVRVGRNLADFPLPGAMTAADRLKMEQKMCVAFEALKKDFGGRCAPRATRRNSAQFGATRRNSECRSAPSSHTRTHLLAGTTR